jgi:hypothetical protein
MLGEKLYELTCKITGRRVLPGTGPGDIKVEVSFQGTGRILGIDTVETGTYEATMKAPGVLFGQGQGLSMTKDGEPVTWHGSGIGKPTGKGTAVNWRGAIFYSTQSQKLARLNGVAAVFEWDVDEQGNAKGTTFEWK